MAHSVPGVSSPLQRAPAMECWTAHRSQSHKAPTSPRHPPGRAAASPRVRGPQTPALPGTETRHPRRHRAHPPGAPQRGPMGRHGSSVHPHYAPDYEATDDRPVIGHARSSCYAGLTAMRRGWRPRPRQKDSNINRFGFSRRIRRRVYASLAVQKAAGPCRFSEKHPLFAEAYVG